MRLYLSDAESRQALTGSVLIVRPSLPDTRSEFRPWEVGDVVLGREAWGGMVPDGIDYRADGHGYGRDGDGEPVIPRWRPASQMPDWAVRHHLRVVKVARRRIDSITEAEARQTGIAPIVHAKPGDANIHRNHLWAFSAEWDRRYGTKAHWPSALAWLSWMELHKVSGQ